MLEKLPDIWIATDVKRTESYIFQHDPTFDGRLFCARIENAISLGRPVVPAGHKVKYVAIESRDYTPTLPPELWLENGFSGCRIYQYVAGTKILAGHIECGDQFVGKVPRQTKCRIAWDENGIRLIGEPVAM